MADIAKPTGVQPSLTEKNTPSRSLDANKIEGTGVDVPSEVQTKAQEFEKMLNDQQKITELAAKPRTDTFDTASDIAENAVFGQASAV